MQASFRARGLALEREVLGSPPWADDRAAIYRPSHRGRTGHRPGRGGALPGGLLSRAGRRARQRHGRRPWGHVRHSAGVSQPAPQFSPPIRRAGHSPRSACGEELLAAATRHECAPRATALVDTLLDVSEEFASLWNERPVMGPHCAPEHIEHPRAGIIELRGESLMDPDQSQILTVFTADSGSESQKRLEFLTLLRSDRLT
ncbi:hypothetical protein [Streptomyces sp. NPDC002133]|uniref:MmyB family transcriptional regulator n=1 Tax=Streptomyces sp. NPDC002133 TaxID=3154409 RepID=UPI00333067A3